MRRSTVLLLVALALGCHRIGDPMAEVGDEATDGSTDDSGESPSACDGAITRTPVVVAETITYSPDVIVDGDTLILVEPGQYGWLRRLDRCTFEELASTVPFLDRAILHEGAVVFTGVSEGPLTYLMRWDEAAADLVFLTEAPFSRLISHSTGLYLADNEQIHRLDQANESLELVHTIDTPSDIPGVIVSHMGNNEAGLYYRVDYDCGCTPTLSRWSITSDETVGVPGTAGTRRIATVGDRMFVNVDQNPSGFGSGIDDIVELPIDGGEPQLLAAGVLADGSVQDIAANDSWVCWTHLARAPRCVNREDPSEIIEFAGQPEGVYRQIGLADDVLYWFVEQNGESTLMAAALN